MLSAPSPFSLVLFGASGHLAKLKLYPALYILELKKRLPDNYCIVGFARSEHSDESFRNIIAESVQKSLGEVNKDVLKRLLDRCFYHRGQYAEEADFAALAKKLNGLEKGWTHRQAQGPVRMAYYSVPPSVFAEISHNLCAGQVHDGKIPFRAIVEKPVGTNLATFETVKKQLTGCFQENEIYLLDHYLGKEAVRNVYYLRYANPILERMLKNTLIHHVEISATEPAGIENRAGYYESSGAFRDMFQSHLMLIMSMLTMRLYASDDAFANGRHDALQQIYLPPASSLDDIVLQGQYDAGEANGEKAVAYRDEQNVDNKSRTNTYVALKLMSRTSRWQGVPFYLRSGKRLSKKETRITIRFQEPRPVGKGSTHNRLDIILQGEAGMRIHMQTKLGGTEPEFRPLVLADPLVCVGDCLPEHGLLLLEAIHGKKQWFVNFDEVHDSWRLLDPIQTYLDDPKSPLHMYEAGTWGPKEANDWIAKDSVEWMYL